MLSDLDCQLDSLPLPLAGRVCMGRDRGGKREPDGTDLADWEGKRVPDGEDVGEKTRRSSFDIGDVSETPA